MPYIEGINLGSYLNGALAVRQAHDMACWAACLSFWGKYVGGGRPRKKQGEIIAHYGSLTNNDTGPKMGGAGTKALATIFTKQDDQGWVWGGMVFKPFNASVLSTDWLNANLGFHGALYIGTTRNGKQHINVIGPYGADEFADACWAMEPWDGSFRLRGLDYYRQSTDTLIAIPA